MESEGRGMKKIIALKWGGGGGGPQKNPNFAVTAFVIVQTANQNASVSDIQKSSDFPGEACPRPPTLCLYIPTPKSFIPLLQFLRS